MYIVSGRILQEKDSLENQPVEAERAAAMPRAGRSQRVTLEASKFEKGKQGMGTEGA